MFIQHALPATETRHVLSALQHSSTFLRRALVENLHLRVVPELHFVVDETAKRAQRIDEILDRIAAEYGEGAVPAAGGDGQPTNEQEDHADADKRSAE